MHPFPFQLKYPEWEFFQKACTKMYIQNIWEIEVFTEATELLRNVTIRENELLSPG